MVDTVLHFEGDRHSMYRLLRAGKNRFGASDEIAIFEMRESGLTAVENPSALLLSERPENTPGSAVGCIMEGSRALMVEIQALASNTTLPAPRRYVTGFDQNRIHMLLAVLEKTAKIKLSSSDVFINVAGGIKVSEPSADLAAALAMASQAKQTHLEQYTVAIGEIGLAGEIRAVPNIEKRLSETARLGFKRALIAKRNHEGLSKFKGLDVIAVENVADAINKALSPL
jgi:DNA repair protein RadA/Sms